ncbi:pteridine reductase [Ferrimonas senticii]|uniref:pteridine reductase n=1 Tax=Ferrimonas senticii TaxID=394566 RepID=UPI0004124407|nr:pteridine reductase [Ferrimonas senticii]
MTINNDKVALVTGSAKRIGAAIIRQFHQQGYRVLIHCRHSKDEAERLAASLNLTRADSAQVLQMDLSSSEGPLDLARHALACWGRVDCLVNNASSFYPTPIGQIDDQHWQQLVGSNMRAPLLLAQALAPTLTQHHGSIINLIDVHGDSPLKNHTLYCMAKAALAMMTKSLALELAPKVRVNGVSPGAILWPEQAISAEKQQALLAEVPLGRLGELDDIAKTVLFLAVDAPYISGQIIAVDGGRSLGALTGA